MSSVQGYIGFHANGEVLSGSYGHALIYSTSELAKLAGAARTMPLIKANQIRLKKELNKQKMLEISRGEK